MIYSFVIECPHAAQMKAISIFLLLFNGMNAVGEIPKTIVYGGMIVVGSIGHLHTISWSKNGKEL